MSSTQAEAQRSAPSYRRLLVRTLVFVFAANCFGLAVHYSQRIARTNDHAGFAQGVLQGALMPLALPNLAVGQDVNIYAAENSGRTYKLGYTMGVDVCGAVFFGFFFWRLSRWRKRQGA
jgi:hypothetical protein